MRCSVRFFRCEEACLKNRLDSHPHRLVSRGVMGVACCGLPPLAVAYSASFKAAERQFTTSGEILHRVGSVGAEHSPPHKAQSDFISRVSTVLNVRLSPTPFVGLSHLTCLSGFEIGFPET